MVGKWVKVGVVALVKKNSAPVSAALGIKIFQLREDGKPDYRKPAIMVFFNGIDELRSGSVVKIDAFESLPLPLCENSVASPSPSV